MENKYTSPVFFFFFFFFCSGWKISTPVLYFSFFHSVELLVQELCPRSMDIIESYQQDISMFELEP